MFVHYSFRTDAGFKVIATLVATALVLWMAGAYALGSTVQAANVTNFSDLLSDSAPSAPANHTITFTLPNGMSATETFVLAFESDFNLSALDSQDDIDVSIGGAAAQDAAAAAGAGVFGVTLASPDAQSITFTAPTDGVSSSTELVIRIGTHSGSGDQQIVNPSSVSSYTVDVLAAGGNPIQDAGQTQIAIVDEVLVTAEVQTTFDFIVSGLPDGFTIPGVATTTATSTTATTLPFEVLSADTSKTLAQRLNVTTNAANGFVVTVEQSQDLRSSTGAIIDSFTDGSYVDTPTGWVAPSENIAQDNTWGHWGLTSDDDSFNAGTNDNWVAASTTPRTIFTHASSSDGVTDDVGSTTIGYQIQITALQEAGNDYNTTLTYIATPTF